jgi:mono/diheme cytochrome c family protein
MTRKLLAAALFVASASLAAKAQETTPSGKGEYLARAGDCIACHSVKGGKAFAGGLRMGTPMGAIYSTNITPDPETGIGAYSLEDFDRAVRAGVAKDGHRLYPAMPYPSYAKISDEDIAALYAFFMKEVPPLKQANKPNEVARWPLAFWNTIYRPKGAYAARADHDAAWNRGAYLVEGLGHCGACHTPRGWLLQEKALEEDSSGAYLQGAELDAWSAPNLRGDLRTGLGGWSQDDIVTFLKSGHNDKGMAFGSMLDVVNNSTPYLTDEDVRAMAVFLKSLPASTRQAPYVYDDAATKTLEGGKPQEAGAAIFLGACAPCHGMNGKGQPPFMPPLAGNPAVLDANPSSLINLVLNGADPLVIKGIPDAYRMPQFRIQLNDEAIAQVLSFVRGAWGNGATAVTTDQVGKLRPVTDPSSDLVIILKMR